MQLQLLVRWKRRRKDDESCLAVTVTLIKMHNHNSGIKIHYLRVRLGTYLTYISLYYAYLSHVIRIQV
jgi:hypothetical protein